MFTHMEMELNACEMSDVKWEDKLKNGVDQTQFGKTILLCNSLTHIFIYFQMEQIIGEIHVIKTNEYNKNRWEFLLTFCTFHKAIVLFLPNLIELFCHERCVSLLCIIFFFDLNNN